MRPTKDAKQAWREKVALFLIMVSCSVFFVGVFGFVPLLLCKEDTVFAMQDIWLQTGENWLVVHGTIYDVKDLIYRHPGGVDGIVDFLGKDASKVFPRAPPVTLPQKCLDMEKVEAFNLNVETPTNNFTNPTCASFSDLDILLGITCHTFAAGSQGVNKFLGDFDRGILSHTTNGLNADGRKWIAIYDRVYDVTTYVDGVYNNVDADLQGDDDDPTTNNPGAYLTPTLNKVIMNSLNSDATDLYEALFGSTEYIACLEELFYVGLLDDNLDTFCYTLNIMMYVMLIFVATLMVIQFLASMVYICPRNRTYTEEDVRSPVMVMVPCYNEGDNELRKTIKSVLNTTYPDENKVLFMVADGLVTGNGEDMSTPEHLANILGFDIDEFEDDMFEYDCIGVTHTKNRARVYHGILQKGHKFLKYIVVVKCGLPAEATTSAKPGNRGKRDSQLVTMGYYNRIHYGRELTELDSAIQRAMVDLNLQADMVRFLMAIDADTRVDTMSITHMVYGMDKKEKVLALCGETKVDNKASSWVTMIQVFEYYNSHHLKKAFEAAFGCVTCLPGCFTMYRIIADDGTPLLPGDGVLYDYSRNDVETLHEKNLYHLGEDRMLTTLLLKHYPDRSLTFIPEAACWTIVPHTFKILLSQRRRWINSTVHNMFELLKVNTMCGVCCVSMKVVVFIDLVATMILPASYCYAMYLIFLVFFEDLPVSTILLILYAIIMGVQVVVFILRSRWDYCWWFFIYFTIGLPVFYLILPTYSFWNMDDFSWGKTRAVGGSAAANAGDEDEDDDDVVREERDFEKEEDDDRSTTSSSSSASSTPSAEESEYSGSGDDNASKEDRSEYSASRAGDDDDDESEYSGTQRSEYSENSRGNSTYNGGRSHRSAPQY
jgi:chitin synthase